MGQQGIQNHLLFMDDLKLFAKSKNEIDSLVQTVHLFSEDNVMQFGIKKCGVLVLERGKVIRTNGNWLSDGQYMKDIDETGYTYLGILEIDERKKLKKERKRKKLRKV